MTPNRRRRGSWTRGRSALALLPVPLLACSLLRSYDDLVGEAARDAGDAEVEPPACEAKVLEDVENCGACGHRCLGARCVDGVCEPTRVKDDVPSPSCVAPHSSGVYWAGNGAGGVVTGAGSRSLYVFGQIEACALLETGRWLKGGAELLEVGSSGLTSVLTSDADHFNVVQSPPAPKNLAVLANTLPVVTDEASGCVLTCKPGGCAGQAWDNLACGLGRPFGIAANATAAFVTRPDDGTIRRIALDGAVSTLVQGQDRPGPIAVDAGGLYWANLGTGTIVASDLDGKNPRTLAFGVGEATALTVDGAHVYFTAAAKGTVSRVSKAGGPRLVLAKAQEQPWGVAVDAEAVYWVTRTARGAVLKTPK